MKNRLIFCSCALFFTCQVMAQISNSQINYELRVDQYWQETDNDGVTDDDNEVRIGLISDSHTGGATAWNSFGPSCSTTNSVYYWQADAPSNSSGGLNLLLYRGTNRSNSPTTFQIDGESWEEDDSWDCSGSGDAGRWIGNYNVTVRSAVKNSSNWWGPDDIAGGEWVNEDWNVTTGTRHGDAKIKTAWRYTYGNACGSALNFGTLTTGTTYSHINSNRSTPAGASADLGYSNVSGNAANDVFYQFTLSASATVTISTNNTGTNFDTYLRLYNSTACGTQIAFNDDYSGTTSLISMDLCAGTYVVQVEGFSSNIGDFNLSVLANNLVLNGGTIAGITNGVAICSGVDPGAFTSSADASTGVSAYTYQWEQSTISAATGYGNISGASSNTYDPSTLTQTTWFRRRVTDACGTVAYSNVIQVVVNSLSTPVTAVSGTNPICAGAATTLTASGGTSGTGATIYWYSGPSGTGTLIGTGNSISVSPTVATTYYLRRQGTCNNTADFSYTLNITAPSSTGLANGDYLWAGNTSNNWNTASNWFVFDGTSFAVATVAPSSTSNVFIDAPNSCTLNNPNTLAGTCNAANVTILSGGLLTLGTGSTLTIEGNWINNSGDVTYVNALTNSTVVFSNSSITSKQIGGNTSTSFDKLTNNSTIKVDINVQTIVKNTLTLNGQFWLVQRLILGTSATSTGTLVYTSGTGFFAGPNFFRRYYAASTNSGNTGVFPMMAAPSYDYRGAKLEYTTAPTSGGWLDGRFVSSTLTFYNGLPIYNDSGVDINNYMDEGYWEIVPGGGISGGQYRLTLRYDGIGGVVSPSDLRIIKSPSPHTIWIADGIHGGVVGNEVIRESMANFSWFVISSTTINPLAVVLDNSSIDCDGTTTSIKWATNSESDIDYFMVERMNANLNWEVIEKVAAKGNSASKTNYEVRDKDKGIRNEVSYYRLSEVSPSGIKTILQYLNSNCVESLEIIVYPNPTRGDFTIEYFNKTNLKSTEVFIFDAYGKQVYQREVNLDHGTNYISIKDLTLMPGTYFIKMIGTNGLISIQKIIVE